MLLITYCTLHNPSFNIMFRVLTIYFCIYFNYNIKKSVVLLNCFLHLVTVVYTFLENNFNFPFICREYIIMGLIWIMPTLIILFNQFIMLSLISLAIYINRSNLYLYKQKYLFLLSMCSIQVYCNELFNLFTIVWLNTLYFSFKLIICVYKYT